MPNHNYLRFQQAKWATLKLSLHSVTWKALSVSFCLVFTSILALHKPLNYLMAFGILAFITSPFIFGLERPAFKRIHFSSENIICALGILFSVASGIYLQELGPLITGVGIFGTFVFIDSWLSTTKKPEKFIIKMSLALVVISAFIIALNLFLEGIYINRYQGFFNNPNSLALFCISIFSFFIPLTKKQRIRPKRYFWVCNALIAVILLLTALTQSRTAVLVLLLNLFLLVFFGKNLKQRIVTTIVIATGVFIAVAIGYVTGILSPLIDKLINTFYSQDITSGRLYAWAIMIDNLSYFGYSDEYQLLFSELESVSGHNVYLDLASRYGVLFSGAFVALLLVMSFKLIKNVRRSQDSISFIALNCISAYAVSVFFLPQTSSPALWLSFALFPIANVSSARLAPHSRNVHG